MFKEVLHLLLKINMFCVLSQNYQTFFFRKIIHASDLIQVIKYGCKIQVSQMTKKKTAWFLFEFLLAYSQVMDENNPNIALIYNSINAWPT